MKTVVGVSSRHVHLTQQALEGLFGPGFELEKEKELRQPGQYASTSVVTLKTAKNELKKVRIIGPVRPYIQVEISKTDAFFLGIDPPVRDSGDLLNSTGVTLVGPKGSMVLTTGCIIASRHLHLNPLEQEKMGLGLKEEVRVQVHGLKGGILDHVHLKVDPSFVLELHLDTDDANAHLISQGDFLEIMGESDEK